MIAQCLFVRKSIRIFFNAPYHVYMGIIMLAYRIVLGHITLTLCSRAHKFAIHIWLIDFIAC